MRERKLDVSTHRRGSLGILSKGLVKVDIGMVPYLKRRARRPVMLNAFLIYKLAFYVINKIRELHLSGQAGVKRRSLVPHIIIMVRFTNHMYIFSRTCTHCTLHTCVCTCHPYILC